MRRKDVAKWRASVESWRAENQAGRCVDDDVARHLAKLEHRAEQYEPERWPALTDEDREWVHGRLVELSAARAAAVAAAQQRLVSTARHLSREVRGYRVTLADAERQLETLALTLDQKSPPIALIPYRQAIAIVHDAFAEGIAGPPCQS